MFNDHALFLREITANPDDDGPRLIYADWLVEQGDPLGDLIHTQCLLARLPEWEPGRADLQQREKKLLAAHGDHWVRGLQRLGVSQIRFRRGFVEEIELTALRLVRTNPSLFAEAPLLHSVDVRNAAGVLSMLVTCDALDRIDSLILRNNQLTNEHLDRLTFSPFVGRLHSLDLSVNEITTGGIHHLSAMRELRSLLLENNLLGPRGAHAIASKDVFGNLRSLSLRGNRIAQEGVAALAGSPHLTELEQLDVSENALGADAVVALVTSHGLSSLTHLDLRQNQLREEGAGRLAGSAWLGRLESLNLRYNGVTDSGVAALARSPFIERIKSLELGGNQVTDVGCRQLAESRHVPVLESLDLSDNGITDAGVAAIVESSSLSQLRLLDLRNNPISGAAEQSLSERGICLRTSRTG